MQLNEFIESTLFEIATGVARAKVRCGAFVSVAPGTLNGERVDQKTEVQFDVEIGTASSASSSGKASGSAEAGFKIFVIDAKVQLGGEGQKADSNEERHSHRVSFSVPVQLNAHHRDDPNQRAEAEFLRNYDFTKPL